MKHLEQHLKTLATERGAALVGLASRERLADAPRSGDPRYLLPSAQSMIAFGIPYSHAALTTFFEKTDWRAFNIEKKTMTRRLYEIGDGLVNFLQGEGFEAVAVEINNTYRPEPGVRDVTECVAMHPDFAHRYGAVAAGLGRLGWSGNVMTAQYGSALLLGTVLTSAMLEPDPVLEENPCDGCKMCAVTCPVGMMHATESVTVQVAGLRETIARKRTNKCCWIGCDGYHGLAPDGTWSNWSPYRITAPLPDDDSAVDALCTRLRKADPDASLDGFNLYTDYRAAHFDPDYMFFSVCAHCANVCWPNRQDRFANRKRLARSGVVVLRVDGRRVAVPATQDIVEIPTSFHANVAMLREEYEAVAQGGIRVNAENAATSTDRAVLHEFQERHTP